MRKFNDPDDDPDDLIFLSPLPTDGLNDDDGQSIESAHGVPALIDFDVDEPRQGRAPIDLGGQEGQAEDDDDVEQASSSRLDLTDLLKAFDQSRGVAAKPPPEPVQMDVVDLEPLPDPRQLQIERLRSELEDEREHQRSLRDDLEAERNNIRRLQADIVNNRRKAEQERERAVREASDRLIKQLLPVIDDFERSLKAAATSENYEMLLTGVHAILRNFSALLARQGIEPVATVGIFFDPDIHEAVAVEETSELEDEIVMEELRKGYLQDGRLLRAALVKVARRVDALAKDEDAEPVNEVEEAEPGFEPETVTAASVIVDEDPPA
jgi:molecular chaperone GrpE